MATGPGVNQGKSAFLEDFLPENRDADLDAVNRAWSAAGNQGTISESLFGKIRARLGLTARRDAPESARKSGAQSPTRSKKPGRSAGPVETAPQANGIDAPSRSDTPARR